MPTDRAGKGNRWNRVRESIILGWLRLTNRIQLGRTTVYVSVVSLIGVDAVTVIVGAAAIWPVGIPILLLGLAAVYLIRRRAQILRRRRDEG